MFLSIVCFTTLWLRMVYLAVLLKHIPRFACFRHCVTNLNSGQLLGIFLGTYVYVFEKQKHYVIQESENRISLLRFELNGETETQIDWQVFLTTGNK